MLVAECPPNEISSASIRGGFAEVSFIQEHKPGQTFLVHSLKLIWRPLRSGEFFKTFNGEIAVGVGHIVPDARAIEQGR